LKKSTESPDSTFDTICSIHHISFDHPFLKPRDQTCSYIHPFSSEEERILHLLDASSNPSRGSRSILLVLAVGSRDDDAAVANVVSGPADDTSARSRDGAEGLVALGVAEGEDCFGQRMN
jgi:hypothetical protein